MLSLYENAVSSLDASLFKKLEIRVFQGPKNLSDTRTAYRVSQRRVILKGLTSIGVSFLIRLLKLCR